MTGTYLGQCEYQLLKKEKRECVAKGFVCLFVCLFYPGRISVVEV